MTEHLLKLYDRYIDRRYPAFGKEFHQVCTCGHQTPWADKATADTVTRCPTLEFDHA